MNDKELGAALVKLDNADLSQVPDDQKKTWQILERDRRRVRWWTILTIAAWIPATLLSMWILVALALIFPADAKVKQLQAEHQAKVGAAADQPVAEVIVEWNGRKINLAEEARSLEISFKMMSVLTALAVLALSFAMLCSVLLIYSTRRATLRQINANLLVISEQLKRRDAGSAA
jgi:hypothetical protein